MENQDTHLLSERALETPRVAPGDSRSDGDVAQVRRGFSRPCSLPLPIPFIGTKGQNIRGTLPAAVCAIPTRHTGVTDQADTHGLNGQSKNALCAGEEFIEILDGNVNAALAIQDHEERFRRRAATQDAPEASDLPAADLFRRMRLRVHRRSVFMRATSLRGRGGRSRLRSA